MNNLYDGCEEELYFEEREKTGHSLVPTPKNFTGRNTHGGLVIEGDE